MDWKEVLPVVRELGSFGLLAFVVWYGLKITLPNTQKDFRATLTEQRKDFQDTLNAQRSEFLDELKRRR